MFSISRISHHPGNKKPVHFWGKKRVLSRFPIVQFLTSGNWFHQELYHEEVSNDSVAKNGHFNFRSYLRKEAGIFKRLDLEWTCDQQ